MKFKAALSDNGRRILEKQFLPCLEKHGRICRVLLSGIDAHFVLTPEDAEGVRVVARLAKETLSLPESWIVTSGHQNLIGFKVQAEHLKSALKAANSSAADFVEIRLTTHRKAGSEGRPKPYLCLTSKGLSTNMTHDMPIGKVFSPEEIDELVKQAQEWQQCPSYVDIQGEQQRLQALVDTLKNLNTSMTLTTTRQGCLYFQVSGAGVQLASEVQGLDVVPLDSRVLDRPSGSSPETRLQYATREGWTQSVGVQTKQFARSLHSSQVALPAKLLLGIAENGGHVHFLFVFQSDTDEEGPDQDIALSYRIPTRDEE